MAAPDLKGMSFLGRLFFKKVKKGMLPSEIKKEKKFYQWADDPKNAKEVNKLDKYYKSIKKYED